MKILVISYAAKQERQEIEADFIRFAFDGGAQLEIQPLEYGGKECLKITSCGNKTETIVINPMVSNQILVSVEGKG
jgi:hypothetical protein